MNHQKIKRVSEIKEGVEDCFLRVLILRVWIREAAGYAHRITMILTDDEGTQIEARIYTDEFEKFYYVRWKEGKWFDLEGANIEHATQFRITTPHKYRLRFNKNTRFDQIFSGVPRYKYVEYATFDGINDLSLDLRCPIDIIGAVSFVGPIENCADGQRVQFTLRDAQFKGLECVAYGEVAAGLVKKFREDFDSHIFVILRCFYVVKSSKYVWLRSSEGLSEIEYDKIENEEWYRMLASYPDPPPRRYSDDNKIDFKIW